MAEPLDLGGFSAWALGGVHAIQVMPEVERVQSLRRQRFEIVGACDDLDGDATRIDQVDGQPAYGVGQSTGSTVGHLGQSQQIGLVLRFERHTAEARCACRDG